MQKFFNVKHLSKPNYCLHLWCLHRLCRHRYDKPPPPPATKGLTAVAYATPCAISDTTVGYPTWYAIFCFKITKKP